jgi:hypothetical protein
MNFMFYAYPNSTFMLQIHFWYSRRCIESLIISTLSRAFSNFILEEKNV